MNTDNIQTIDENKWNVKTEMVMEQITKRKIGKREKWETGI